VSVAAGEIQREDLMEMIGLGERSKHAIERGPAIGHGGWAGIDIISGK
jgi:hypothetical protein